VHYGGHCTAIHTTEPDNKRGLQEKATQLLYIFEQRQDESAHKEIDA
jgi:hypothetical protein